MNAASPERGGLRIAFVIDRWQPRRGGAERALCQLAAHLASRGHEVLAFGLAGPRAGEEAPGRFVALRARGMTRAARERSFAERALAAARDAGCDLTVGVRHLSRADLYWPHGGAHAETLAALGKRARGRHRTFLALERELLEGGGARAVACVSSLVRDELLRHYPASAERLRLVPNGVDLERFHPAARAAARAGLRARLSCSRPGVLIAFAGRNPRLKGLDVLLAALAGLAHLPWTLVAAGPQRLGRWRRLAARVGLPKERVHFFRDLPSLELAAGADLSALPARRDPAPLSVLEALASGTPVLASARAGTSECIVAGAGGEVLADAEDVAAWRAALERWISRASDGATVSEAVRQGVLGRGLPAWLARLEALVLELAVERALP